MKKLILMSLFAFAATSFAVAQQQTPAAPAPVENKNQAEIEFVEESHDFGNIKEGTLATYEFKFKNTGKEPLILTNVTASCGCTTPEWPKEPIKPGATGIVKAVYNSQGRPGAFQKSITVQSNAKTSMKILNIKGNVESAPREQPSPVVNPQH